VDKYYRSPKFKGFDPITQADKRSVFDRFCETARGTRQICGALA
jgi:hypothetical protein